MRVLRGFSPSMAPLALAILLPFAGAKAEETMVLGVQTHFSQRWPARLWSLVEDLDVPVRDALPWPDVEQLPGQFRLPRHLRGFLENMKKTGHTALLTFAHPNPGFVEAAETDAGTAQSEYIGNLLALYGDQIRGIAIGNEINGLQGDREKHQQQHVEELRAAYAVSKAFDPGKTVLGGAVHSVAIGFLDDIFAKGGLQAMDGISLNAYRSHPEHLATELQRLNDLMETHGKVLPIYVTEFGIELDDPGDAPDYLIKMVAILSSSGVREAYWYAMIDEAHFRNMGLFTYEGTEKPAGKAFRLVKRLLDEHGNFQRQPGGTLLRHYASADGEAHILWGAGQGVAFAEGASVFSSDGAAIPAPSHLGASPLVVSGAAPTFTSSPVLADSLLQFGEAPWRYAVIKSDQRTPLETIDWDWTSYLGASQTFPLAGTSDEVVLSGPPYALNTVVEEVALPDGGPYLVKGDWQVTGLGGDGVRLRIIADDSVVLDRLINSVFSTDDLIVPAADVLAFELSPGTTSVGDRVKRYIRVEKAP